MEKTANIIENTNKNNKIIELSQDQSSNKSSSEDECEQHNPKNVKINEEIVLKDNDSDSQEEKDDSYIDLFGKQKNIKNGTKKNNAKDKNFYDFINGIFHDDVTKLEKILKACQSHAMINRISPENITPIQYATLYGCINAFDYLLSLKAQTDKEVEGWHLIHLSLARGIFKKDQEKCVKMFKHIYEKLPEQRHFIDRLGRSFLHLIFEYDFVDALDGIDVQIEDLFQEDNNGDYVINYTYIYHSNQCFWKIAKDPKFLAEIYLKTREKFEQNKSLKFLYKEQFLNNLFLRQNFYVIAIIVVNSNIFANELLEDLNFLYSYYNNNINSQSGYEDNNIYKVRDNIEYIIKYLTKMTNKKDINSNQDETQDAQFDFPHKIHENTAIVFNNNCIKHAQLPDDPIKHMLQRTTMYENSDRLSCLIHPEKGIILNDQVFHFNGVNNNDYVHSTNEHFIFHESKRLATLNDILKCHDIKYIKFLKEFCEKMGDKNSHKHNKDNYSNNNSPKNSDNNINFSLNSFGNNNIYNSTKNIHKNNNNNIINNGSVSNNSPVQNHNKNENNNYNSLFIYDKIDCDTYVNKYTYENIFNTAGCVFDAIDLVMKKSAKNAFALIRPPGHHSGYYGPVENPIIKSTGFCIINNVAVGAAYTKYKYKDIIKKIAIFDFDVHHGNGTEEIIQMLNSKNFKNEFYYEKTGKCTMEDEKQINWLDFDDAKNVLFISTHIYSEQNPKVFYPYSGGKETNTQKDSEIYPGGIYNIPFGFKTNYPYEYRNIFRAKVIPRLYKFKPDIIFISAGFDGHEMEAINQRHMLLQEFDFAYITQQLQFIANKFCKGRMVSVLEGGYNVNTGLISSFAQSAFTHARFLNIAVNMYHCFDVKLTGLKRKEELMDDTETYNKANKVRNKPRRSERIKHLEEDYKKDI